MGASPYWYIEEYDEDVQGVLDRLRQREFDAGRYYPAMDLFAGLEFPITDQSPSPGARHGSIDEAREAAAECGTQSILDLDEVSEMPGFGAVSPLDEDVISDVFGTAKPTPEMVKDNLDFLDYADRLLGVYFFLFEGDQPVKIVFAGYSVD